MKNAVFWDVAPCRSCVNRPAHAGSSLADFTTLNMEAIRSSETSVHTISTWRHIPEDGILHIQIIDRLLSKPDNTTKKYEIRNCDHCFSSLRPYTHHTSRQLDFNPQDGSSTFLRNIGKQQSQTIHPSCLTTIGFQPSRWKQHIPPKYR
jgi:hypothetical protein